MKYKAIIFDLGGVLFDLNYHKTAEAFKALGLTKFDDIYSQARQTGIFDEFEKGHLQATGFREALRKYLPAGTTDAQIDSAWNAMLLGIKPDKLELLDEVKKRFRIFLLSNTNDIHLAQVFRMNQEAYGFTRLSSYMEKEYYSCLIGMRKPDAEIFRQVLDENELNPAETLFIDDSIQHIEGARRVGLQVHHLTPDQALARVLNLPISL